MSEHDELDVQLSRAAALETEIEAAHVDDADLIAFQRGALATEKVDAVDRHLASCAECRALAVELARPLDDLTRHRARRTFFRPLRWRAAMSAAGFLVAVAVAASVMLRGSAIDRYAIEGPLGGVQEVRGDAAPSTTYDANASVRLILRPEQSTTTKPTIELYREAADGTWSLARDVSVEFGEGGGIEVIAPARTLFERTGRQHLMLLIRPSSKARGQEWVANVDYLGGKP